MTSPRKVLASSLSTRFREIASRDIWIVLILPKRLRCDNGPEFQSKALLEWAYLRGVEVEFIEPGKPIQNDVYWIIQWSLPGRMLERPCLHEHWSCTFHHREMEKRIQRRTSTQWNWNESTKTICIGNAGYATRITHRDSKILLPDKGGTSLRTSTPDKNPGRKHKENIKIRVKTTQKQATTQTNLMFQANLAKCMFANPQQVPLERISRGLKIKIVIKEKGFRDENLLFCTGLKKRII